MTRCKSCGAPVLWCKVTNSDRRMPVDPEPSSRGNVRVVNGFATVLGALEVHAADAEPLYLSHFVTCPQAAKHRRAR